MSLVYDAIGVILPRQDQTDNEEMIWWNALRLQPDPRNSDWFWRTLMANVAATTATETSKNEHGIAASTRAP